MVPKEESEIALTPSNAAALAEKAKLEGGEAPQPAWYGAAAAGLAAGGTLLRKAGGGQTYRSEAYRLLATALAGDMA